MGQDRDLKTNGAAAANPIWKKSHRGFVLDVKCYMFNLVSVIYKDMAIWTPT